jgi:hypothetical protein
MVGWARMLPHCNSHSGAKKASFLIWINANSSVEDVTVTIPKKLPTLEAENKNKQRRSS